MKKLNNSFSFVAILIFILLTGFLLYHYSVESKFESNALLNNSTLVDIEASAHLVRQFNVVHRIYCKLSDNSNIDTNNYNFHRSEYQQTVESFMETLKVFKINSNSDSERKKLEEIKVKLIKINQIYEIICRTAPDSTRLYQSIIDSKLIEIDSVFEELSQIQFASLKEKSNNEDNLFSQYLAIVKASILSFFLLTIISLLIVRFGFYKRRINSFQEIDSLLSSSLPNIIKKDGQNLTISDKIQLIKKYNEEIDKLIVTKIISDRHKTNNLFRSFCDIIIVINSKHYIEYINDSAKDNFGFSSDTLMKNIFSLESKSEFFIKFKPALNTILMDMQKKKSSCIDEEFVYKNINYHIKINPLMDNTKSESAHFLIKISNEA